MKLFNPVVSILCICVVAFGDQEAKLDRIRVFDYGRRAVLSLDNTAILELFLGDSLKHNATSVNVDGKTIVAQFKESSTRLVITQSTDKNLVNYNFAWYTPHDTVYLNDTIFLGGGLTYETHWFGGPQVLQQAWPIQNVQDKKGYDLCPYVAFDIFQRPASGLERFWMSSQKVALVVPSTVPLWTKLSDSSYLSLQAQYKDSPYINFPHRNASEPYLEYTLIVPQSFESVTLPEFYLALAEKYLDRPTSMFDEKLIEKPIWTTWARYGINVTQDDVTSFANEIVDRGFAISQLELDDMWTPAYGDYEIDTEKFPDFKTMINNLEKQNIRLTAWVHPFINTNAKNGNDVALREYFVKGSDNQAEIVTWWDGEAYVLDMTNSDARNWFTKQLKRMQDNGIFTFKFDAGEINFLPKDLKLTEGNVPNDFSKAYAKFTAEFGTAVENRVGGGNQNAPILVRTMDRRTEWFDGGLQTVIPSTLHYSLLGYHWNLPDIIGGNGANLEDISDDGIVKKDSELYIRWVQVNAFLLVLQFSFCPWDYPDSEKLVNITKSVLQQREPYIPYIKSECHAAAASGLPVIRPLWWALSTPEAVAVDDEFLVGDRLLVAPVVYENTFHRNVILPEGRWKDDRGEIFTGPTTLVDVDVPIERVPHYWRLDDNETETSTKFESTTHHVGGASRLTSTTPLLILFIPIIVWLY